MRLRFVGGFLEVPLRFVGDLRAERPKVRRPVPRSRKKEVGRLLVGDKNSGGKNSSVEDQKITRKAKTPEELRREERVTKEMREGGVMEGKGMGQVVLVCWMSVQKRGQIRGTKGGEEARPSSGFDLIVRS